MSREIKQLPDLTDNDLMPSSKHKGEKMINVPDDYLLYIYNNFEIQPRVKKYIEDNLDAIKKNAKK